MTHDIARGLRLSGLALLLGAVGATSLTAQDPRDQLVQRAFNEFDAGRRVQLLVRALNPALGPPSGAWSVAVQLLAQTLLEDKKDSLAAVWLRWAARQAPDLRPDTVQFLPSVVAAVRDARAFVAQTRSPQDSAAGTTWQWPAQETGASQGTLRATVAGLVPVKAEVQGVGPIDVGRSIPFNPGSYYITASASGYDTVRATREVLPGITTLVELRLRATPIAQLQAPQPTVPPVAGQRKKKSPVVWIVAGVGAAAVAAVLLGGGKGPTPPPPPPPNTGGIIITFPNP